MLPFLAAAYAAAVKDKFADYAQACPADVPRLRNGTLFLCPDAIPAAADHSSSGPLNIFVLLPLWGGLWSLLAWRRR